MTRRSIRGKDMASYVPLVIGDDAQLRTFAASREFMSKQPIILSLPGMLPAEGFSAGEQLNKERSECGCSLGAQAMAAGFLISLAGLTIHYGVTLALLKRLPIAMVAAFLFAALGKVVGITLGRRRARRTVARILAIFTCL
jgi:hypothetical protein